MTFPIELSREAGLVFATLIGVAFGFVLERAGFGRAPKLAAQFYLRDLTVFKVMFGAIVTAMLGLVALSALGFANLRDISESISSWTYVWPMLIGGFVLGIGFIVSGYCPGTSIVSMASGNVDGLFAFGGVVTGTFVYSELLQNDAFHRFHNSGEKGAWFLFDLIKVPPQLLAALIAVMAVLAFMGAELLEHQEKSRKKFAYLAFAILALFTIAAKPTQQPSNPATSPITATELAQLVVSEPWRLRIVDLRDAKSFAKTNIPGSENLKSVADLPDDGRTLVVVGSAATLPERARVLQGGIDAWNREPLAAALAGAAPPPAPAAAPAGGTFTKPKKKGGGCSA